MPKALDTTGRECHDCGQNDPRWCSINHGVLVCDECSSVHLSLGRHISQIKSLEKSHWSPTQLNLINELSSHGANLIWEYSLRDPHNKLPRKKPTANDAFPIKADFIRAKYQQMAYVNRSKDETNGTLEDINLQLHSIVRTDNIITCLRFLSQGADPNFRNPETGTSAMHVAASRGQQNQIELLCIFGGDPATIDAAGVPPDEHARANGYTDLADRLIELQYELTDRLICFIGGKQPDHKTDEHILLANCDKIMNRSSPTSIARQKLQQLSDTLFEDLAMDIFDEVDRRELKSMWQTQVDKSLVPLHVVPFLPVNPTLSATRNQGRQKLARYGIKEFHGFIYDVLDEFRRRYFHFIQRTPSVKSPALSRRNDDLAAALIESDDEPYYDKVASDEESSSLEQQKRTKQNRRLKKIGNHSNKDSTENGALSSLCTTTGSDHFHEEIAESNHSNPLRTRVANTELQVKYLASAHLDLKNELAVLHQMIQRLLDENLLSKLDQQVPDQTSVPAINDETSKIILRTSQLFFDNISRKSSPFIESDYDNTTLLDDPDNPLSNLTTTTIFSGDKRSSRNVHRFPQIDEYSSDTSRSYRHTDFLSRRIEPSIPKSATNPTYQPYKREIPISIQRSRSCSEGRRKLISPSTLVRKGSFNHVPWHNDVIEHTRNITYHVTEFFTLIKQNQTHRYVAYAERINHSVQDMIQLSHRYSFYEINVRTNLNMLIANTQQLLFHAMAIDDNPTSPTHFLIDDCYDIALATRNLLSIYEKL
ncbi:unnamed protein product [Adineta ricciae]|uniref:Arf-GAP domain-containing protein n=1 Tax=Adineta ricciae TaxID=249248 RepID=A0A813TMR4_ADIRI|nr:unnamed protein product [Adineta ricciae]